MLLMESIDLHGYRLEEANKIIEQFINESYLENVKKLIVIKRKGLHSQK
jgi:DNA-nicking Smr family endonuclease